MESSLFNSKGSVEVGAVYSEEDLKRSGRKSMSPPPVDGRCECCGRHIRELKRFGEDGEHCVSGLHGAYFVEMLRRGPYDEEAEEAMREARQHEDPLAWMIEKYGEEEGEMLYCISEDYNSVFSSWECRDCMVLDQYDYFETMCLICEENSVCRECQEKLDEERKRNLESKLLQ